MQRGQASLEYVMVIGVVAVALAIGASVADAGAIPRAVASQVHRAYCLVAHGDCLGPDGPRPCVESASARTRERRIKLVLARLADGRTVLVEHRSDGTVAVTATDMGEAVGGPRIAGVGVKLGGRLSAGRRWVVADEGAARRLLAEIETGPRIARTLTQVLKGGGGEERFVRFGTRGEATTVLKALGLEAHAGVATGVRIDGRTGRRTLELGQDRALIATLGASVARATGGVEQHAGLELAVDRHGDPLTLTLHRTAHVHGEVNLPAGRASGGDRLEAEARVDLTDPRARRLFDDRDLAGLANHLAGHARLDVRLYATTRDEDSHDRLAHETIDRTDTARLIHAAGREPGRPWAVRFDCTPS